MYLAASCKNDMSERFPDSGTKSAIEIVEKQLMEMNEQIQSIKDLLEYLKAELETFVNKFPIKDLNDQAIYRSLRDEIYNLQDRAIPIIAAVKLDRAEFQILLKNTIVALESFEHMLLSQLKLLKGQPAKQPEVISQLGGIQTELKPFKEKAVAYNLNLSLN